MPVRRNDDDSENFKRDEYWQVKYKLRTIEDWRTEVNQDRERMEKRIRELEDFKLTAQTIHRNMIKWGTIASTAFAAGISLLEHLLFK